MTDSEFIEIKHTLTSGSRMILQKIEKAAKEDENSPVSLSVLGEYADIMKDISETVKNMCKASYYRQEHSDKMI